MSLPFKHQPSRWGREKLGTDLQNDVSLMCEPSTDPYFLPRAFIRSHTSHISLSLCLTGWLKVVLPLFSAVLIWWSLPARQWACSSHLTFAEVCMPLELAVSLANDSGAGSQGTAGRLARLPRLDILGACEAHHCLLILLPFLFLLLPLFFVVVVCLCTRTFLGVRFFFFPSDIFLISEGMMRGGKKEKSVYGKKIPFINLFIVYEIKSFFSFSSLLKPNECLKEVIYRALPGSTLCIAQTQEKGNSNLDSNVTDWGISAEVRINYTTICVLPCLIQSCFQGYCWVQHHRKWFAHRGQAHIDKLQEWRKMDWKNK